MQYYFAANISDEDAERLGCEPGLHAVITPNKERRDSVRKSFSRDIGENFKIGEIESSSFIAGETDSVDDINMVFYALTELQVETAQEYDDLEDDEDGIFSEDEDDDSDEEDDSDDGDDGDDGDDDHDDDGDGANAGRSTDGDLVLHAEVRPVTLELRVVALERLRQRVANVGHWLRG